MPDISDAYTKQVFERYSAPLPSRHSLTVHAVRIVLAAMCDRIMSTTPYRPFTTTLNEWMADVLEWSDEARHKPLQASLSLLAGRLQGSWAIREFYAADSADAFTDVRQALIVLPWALAADSADTSIMHCRHIMEILGAYDQDARVTFARLHNQLKAVEDR